MTPEERENLSRIIYNIIPVDYRKRVDRSCILETTYVIGMIPISHLKDGHIYYGHSKSTNEAMWDSESQHFTYMKNVLFAVNEHIIKPPENNDGDDHFVAVEDITDENK